MEVIKMEAKEGLELKNSIELLKQTQNNDQKTICELKKEIKEIKKIQDEMDKSYTNSLQSIQLDMRDMKNDFKNNREDIKAIMKQVQKITEAPQKMNREIKIGVIVAILSSLGTAAITFLFKR